MICDDCKMAEYFIKKGRADTLDEIKEALERRLHWENEFYKMAIRHSIGLLDLMRSKL